MSKLNELLQRIHGANPLYFMNKPIYIGDKHFSIQASSGHCSHPRKDTFLSDYTHFEVLAIYIPEELKELWAKYKSPHQNDVYEYVPREYVIDLLNTVELKEGYNASRHKQDYSHP